jgi:hypothetical protein
MPARHQEDIAVVRDTCAAKVRVTKTVGDIVGIVVTGAAIPASQTRIGTELDHPERHRSAGKGVAVAGSADKRIDITGQIPLGDHLDRQEQNHRKANCLVCGGAGGVS